MWYFQMTGKTPKISKKLNKSYGTQNQIKGLVKGLGKYTFQCGFNYINFYYEVAFCMVAMLCTI